MRLTLALRTRALLAVAAAALAIVLLAPAAARAQAVMGTCTSCSSDTGDAACGRCIADGLTCFMAIPAAERRNSVFMTGDGHDARTLHFAHLVGGVAAPGGPELAVNRSYGSGGWLYYGGGAPAGYCAPPGGPPAAFPSAASYAFPNHVYEDTFNNLDCYNGEIDRFYLHAPGHTDGDRVCDGEQAEFAPTQGAVFDLGGEGNRVVVFPYTDHPPLPCESWEYSVWLSDDPHATMIADPAHPDPSKWNPALLTRVFLQGWIPDAPAPATENDALHPDLGNPTQHDGIAQVFSLPCGLTFRYAAVVAGNNGNPSPACAFYSFDAELDALAGLNEDDTSICPDADGDGFPDRACGGTDCDDHDPNVHPNAVETCSTGRDLNCDGMVTGCPAHTTCVLGLCAPECIEGACAEGFTCAPADGGLSACVPTQCAGMTCPPGQLCGMRGCQDPCDGARCPPGQVCRGGACFDPCVGVHCPMHQHCEADPLHSRGRCAPDCSCVPCVGTATCNTTTGRCDAPGCSMMTCPAGQVLDCTGEFPQCVVPCAASLCPLGQRCDYATNQCVHDACFGVNCPSGLMCVDGACTRPAMDGGVGRVDAGATDGARRDGSVRPGDDGGCGCAVPGAGRSPARRVLAGLAAALAAAALGRRGRRRRRAH